VSWSIAASCQRCFYCEQGLPQKCEQLFKYGHQKIDDQHPLSGGLATHCHLAKGSAIIKVPDTLPDFVACPANCATATVAGALRIAGECKGQTIVIFGAGMLGLTAAAMAHEQGAQNIVVSDIDSGRAELALKFGATSIDLNELDGLTGGRGADVIFEISGSPDAMESAVDLLRIGGRLILVGAVFPNRAVSLQAEQIVRRMLRIEGLHNYQPADLRTAIKFLMETHDRFPFQELVQREYRLDDINDAVNDALNNRFIRVAIRP
jgi:alcohol dehydrogenase